MRWMKILTVICFCSILIAPLFAFNFEPDVVSEIDNRKLAENPFTADGQLTDNIQNYLNDRIGFRDEMILGYTVLNDRLFGKMVHPTYTYGKDGYVYASGLDYIQYGQYHEAFADMIANVQEYCEARNVPFLMVFHPAKPAVVSDHLPAGQYYNREWVDRLMEALEERGVRYLDNTTVLQEKYQAGEPVFNIKYDANHWNDLGAWYGTSAALRILQEDLPTIHITQREELTIGQKLETTLPVSKFPIEEYVPSVTVDMECGYIYEPYASELERHQGYQAFAYFTNEKRQQEGAPNALVFQGSYMNGFGYKYFANAFGEYVYVHDYQNILNLDYYFNVFQPDCLIFEVAEYTLSDGYFSYQGMLDMDLNPSLSKMRQEANTMTGEISQDELTVNQGEVLTKITWHTENSYRYVWLDVGTVYDFRKCEDGWELTLKREDYEKIQNALRIVTLETDGKSITELTVL